jgi:hypothetical protein
VRAFRLPINVLDFVRRQHLRELFHPGVSRIGLPYPDEQQLQAFIGGLRIVEQGFVPRLEVLGLAEVRARNLIAGLMGSAMLIPSTVKL